MANEPDPACLNLLNSLVSDEAEARIRNPTSGPAAPQPLSIPEEAAAFAAVTANLRYVIDFIAGPSPLFRAKGTGGTLDNIFAAGFEAMKKKSEAARIIFADLTKLQNIRVKCHIIIAVFLFYEPLQSRSLRVLEPEGGDTRRRARYEVTETLLGSWGVRFDGIAHESAFFRAGLVRLLLCAVTYPNFTNIDKPGLAIDLLKYFSNIYLRESEARLTAFREIVDSYAKQPHLSEYQANRLRRHLL